MRRNMKAKKALVVTIASSLTLFGGALVSAAYADTTPSPTPSISTQSDVNPVDAKVNDETDASVVVGENQDVKNLISVQVAEDINANSNEDQNGDSNVQENDIQSDDLIAENQQEDDAFNQDINQAEQNGNHDDAVELAAAATIVTTVTAPEIQAMSNDDAQAQAIIVGTPTK